MKTVIYLDHAATTPLDPRVRDAMLPFFGEVYGNPSSIHSAGRTARVAVERARVHVAALLHADPGSIVFMSGGTEADNTAIMQASSSGNFNGTVLSSSAAEHHAVLQQMEYAVSVGARHIPLPVQADGRVLPEDFDAALPESLALMSVMHGNNETGALSDIALIARAAQRRGALFHSDMVQTAGKIPCDLPATAVDFASISAHKIHGPKGVGALYVRKEATLAPGIRGGAQERKRRGGTENVAAIVGFGEAARLALEEMEPRLERWTQLRRRFVELLMNSCGDAVINGTEGAVLPNIVSVTFPFHRFGIDGEGLLMNLDLAGLCVSSGSACTAGSFEASHVMKAIGHDDASARASLRCSFGAWTSTEEVEQAALLIARQVQVMSA